MHIIKNEREIDAAMADAAKYDREILVEKFIPGRELTIGILGDQALPIMEIIPKGGFYDFTNKYPFLNPRRAAARSMFVRRKFPTSRPAPSRISPFELIARSGCEVYSRVDVILPDEGEPTVLEINTIPGMTEASLLPEAAAVAGIGYPELCARIIELSRKRMGAKQ